MKKRIFAFALIVVILLLTATGCGKTEERRNQRNVYGVNVNSLKFHYIECSSVERMSDEHLRFYRGYRDDLVEMGYSPCGNCKP